MALFHDPAGGVLVTGSFESKLDMGAGALTSAGGNDIFLARFEPSRRRGYDPARASHRTGV